MISFNLLSHYTVYKVTRYLKATHDALLLLTVYGFVSMQGTLFTRYFYQHYGYGDIVLLSRGIMRTKSNAE